MVQLHTDVEPTRKERWRASHRQEQENVFHNGNNLPFESSQFEASAGGESRHRLYSDVERGFLPPDWLCLRVIFVQRLLSLGAHHTLLTTEKST